MFDAVRALDTTMDCRARVELFDWIESLPAGLLLEDAICDLAPGDLDDREMVIVIAAKRRLISEREHDLATWAAASVERLGQRNVQFELAPALQYSMSQTSNLLTVGLAARGQLPATGAALEAGAITFAQALAIATGVGAADDATAQAGEARVLADAPTLPPKRLERATRAALYDADTDGANRAHRDAQDERRVEYFDAGLASGGVAAIGPTLAAAEINYGLDALAVSTGPDDDRTRDQLRFDALHDAVCARLADPNVPRRPSKRGVNVTVTLATAQGLAQRVAMAGGYGPIAPLAAYEYAQDAEWEAWIVDAATGGLTGLGSKGYTPTVRGERLVKARHEYSVQPMSTVRSERSQYEHAIPFDAGGATDPANGAPLDKRPHDLKTEGRWRHRQDPDGTRHLTSPAGFTYTSPPTAYPVDGDPPPF